MRQIAALTTQLSFPAQHELARQGARYREFVVMKDGAVVDGRRVATLAGGDSFGEVPTGVHGIAPASIITTEASRVLVIVGRDFARLLREVPSIGKRLLPNQEAFLWSRLSSAADDDPAAVAADEKRDRPRRLPRDRIRVDVDPAKPPSGRATSTAA